MGGGHGPQRMRGRQWRLTARAQCSGIRYTFGYRSVSLLLYKL